MKSKLIFSMTGVILSFTAYAQNEVDALRYSQNIYGGTARFTSMAGAFGALGGDFSTLSTNPAGIGIYRRNEFTITPSFFHQNTTSNYKGNFLYDDKTNLNFGNIGIVLSYYEPETKKMWKGVTFGFGYNRLNNFNNRISMAGKNTNSSLLDTYLSDAVNAGGDTSAMDQFGTQLALYTGAIWKDTANGIFYHQLPAHGEEQSKAITTSGSMGETVFTLGGNYNDKLYLGATLGIPHIRYEEQSTYQEIGDTNALNGFRSFALNQDLFTTGSGFNFKFGMIYKPVDWFRIGGAFHTPTYWSMHDDWSSSMTTKFSNPNETFTSKSPIGSFDYTLITPTHVVGSIGFVIKKIGLIGADYEYVDYSSAYLRSGKYKFLAENNAIRSKYMGGNNLRIGTEWRLQPLSIRGGIAYYGSPFRGGVGNDDSRMDYTAGLGFREENFFLDFAYVFSKTTDNYYLYDASVTSPSVNDLKSSRILMTLGFKF